MRQLRNYTPIFCILFFHLTEITFAQESSFPLDTVHSEIVALNTKLDTTQNLLIEFKSIILEKMSSRNRLVDSTLSLYKISSGDLKKSIDNIDSKKELEVANHVMKTQSYLIDIFGAWFTGFGLFFITLTILAPFAIYFLGIKPAQKAIERINEDISNQLQILQDEEISFAIANIDSHDNAKAKKSLNIISSRYWKLGDKQKDQIIVKMLPKNNMEQEMSESLIRIFADEKNNLVDLYFQESIKDSRIIAFTFMKYVAENGFEDYIDTIGKFLNEFCDRQSLLRVLFVNMNDLDLKKAQNSEKLVSYLNDNDIRQIQQRDLHNSDMLGNYEIGSGTLLGKRLKETNVFANLPLTK